MSKVISIANQKGGVGKTTTSVNIASGLGEAGKKVLLIDMDPQGNACSGVNIKKDKLKSTVYDILVNDEKPDNIIIETKFKNLSVLPSNIHLSGAQLELLSMPEKEYRLKKGVKAIKKNYDYIIIDCPPSLGMLTLNALTASDSVIIPMQCEYYALEGLSQLLKIIKLVQQKLNTKLELEGVVLTMYDSRTILSGQVASDIREHFKDKTYNTIIPRNIRLSEAPSFGQPINYYDKNSTGAQSYKNLVKEIINA